MKLKRWAAALLIVVLAFGLVACQTPEDETPTPEDPSVQEPGDDGELADGGSGDDAQQGSGGASNDSFSGTNSSPITGDVLANDTTPAGETLDKSQVTVSKVSDTANGALLLNADGTFSYQATPDFEGTDSFTYKVCANDDAAQCGEATVTLTVAAGDGGGDGGGDGAPTATNDIYTVEENGELFANVLDNDTDPAGDALSVTVPPAQDVLSGTLDLQPSGQFLYRPNADFTGVDGFVYQVCNTNSQCAQAAAEITVEGEGDGGDGGDGGEGVVANDDSVATTASQPVTFNVLDNDTDSSGGTLTVTEYTELTDGVPGSIERVEGTAGEFTYTQDVGVNQAVTANFTYTACNESDVCDDATVTIAVTSDADGGDGGDGGDTGSGGGATPGVGLIHTVGDLEWLVQVARCYGTTEQDLINANPGITYQYRHWLYPGQVLNVPNPGNAGAITGPPCVQYHTVAQGETLNGIATAYGIQTSELQRINGIYNANYVQAGQLLVLPTPIPPSMAR